MPLVLFPDFFAEGSGNNGIWIKQIRLQAHLTNSKDLDKILKLLENKKLIRSFKSVIVRTFSFYLNILRWRIRSCIFYMAWRRQSSTEELYFMMRFGLPSYYLQKSKNIDTEFITTLSKRCYTFIKEKKLVTVQDVRDMIEEKKISNVCSFLNSLTPRLSSAKAILKWFSILLFLTVL